MKSILQKPSANNGDKPRNGFDLSMQRAFTAPVGMILPVFWTPAVAGDKFKLNSQGFIRTEALQSAAFVRMKAHIEHFFVPYKQLYCFFNEFYNGTQDIHTSFAEGTLNAGNFAWPVMDLFDTMRFESNSLMSTVSGSTVEMKSDMFGVPKAFNARRLYDMLGYGSVDTTPALLGSTNNGGGKFDNLALPYLAYHRIFYSKFNIDYYYPKKFSMFNVDKYHGGRVPSDVATEILSTIHYRPWRKDMFTNIMPSPTFSGNFANAIADSFMTNGGFNVRTFITGEGLRGNTLTNTSSSGDDPSVYDGSGSTLSLLGEGKQLSAGDIRSLFAFDKLLRITANSGSHYDEQTFAHLGYKIPKGLDQEAYTLGEQVIDINIGQVVATSTTDPNSDAAGTSIGDIAGKGFGEVSGSPDINFTCPADGVIMTLFSIEPIPMYASMGCKNENRYLNSLDFFRPEFDNVGMVPAYSVSFDASLVGINDLPTAGYLDGWTYRYSELKSNVDIVNEGFWNTDKSTWTAVKQDNWNREKTGPAGTVSYDYLFYISPQWSNPFFVMDFPYYVKSTPNDTNTPFNLVYSNPTSGNRGKQWENKHNNAQRVYGHDNFLINLYIKAFKTSIMSVHSLPKI